MNAMLAPAVTMMRLPRATSMPFSAASLRAIRARGTPETPRRLGTRECRAAGATARTALRRRLRRRTVVHDALTERNRAGHLTNEVAYNGHDWRLDLIHPGREARDGHATLSRTS